MQVLKFHQISCAVVQNIDHVYGIISNSIPSEKPCNVHRQISELVSHLPCVSCSYVLFLEAFEFEIRLYLENIMKIPQGVP